MATESAARDAARSIEPRALSEFDYEGFVKLGAVFTCGLFCGASQAHTLAIAAQPLASIGDENANCAPAFLWWKGVRHV